MSKRLRTFIGIDPGPAIRAELVALQESLARTGVEVKWVEPENLHVTLIFLGEVALGEVPAVCDVIGECVAGHKAFRMAIGTVGCFPNPRRPRILWAGVKQGTPEVTALHDALEEPLHELGCYRREERRYVPHVTLGRVKSDPPTDKLARGLHQYLGWKAGEMEVRELHVMSSELTRSGPLYTVLGRVAL